MYYNPSEVALFSALLTGFVGGTAVAATSISLYHWDHRKNAISKKCGTWQSLSAFWFIVAAVTFSTLLIADTFEPNHVVFLNLLDFSGGEPDPFRFKLMVSIYNVCTLFYLSRYYKLAGLITSFVLINVCWWLFYASTMYIMQGFR